MLLTHCTLLHFFLIFFCCCIPRVEEQKKEVRTFCDNSNLLINTKLTSVDFANFRDMLGEKKGPGSPGTFKKSPGTFGLL